MVTITCLISYENGSIAKGIGLKSNYLTILPSVWPTWVWGITNNNGHIEHNDRGEPTASVLSADGFPLMAGPNFQPSDGNPIVISILRQLADVPENVPEI
jgi:hypothetical protein